MNIIRENILQAKAYAEHGWRVVPLHHPIGIGCSCGRPGCKAVGKHPRIKQWQDNATTDETVIDKWFEQWPEANIGIRLGPESGIVDVEFDDSEGQATAEQLLNAIQTPTYQSQRSTHRLFVFPEHLEIPKAVIHAEGLEIRFGTDKRGAQSVFPPSVHKSGKPYAWLEGLSPTDCELAPFPRSLVELIQPKRTRDADEMTFTMKSNDTFDSHPGEASGNRHRKLCELVGRELAINGATAELPAKALAWAQRCSPPMNESEVIGVITQLANKHVEQSPSKATELVERLTFGNAIQ